MVAEGSVGREERKNFPIPWMRHDETIGNDVDNEVLDPGEELHLVGGGVEGGGGRGEKRMGRVKR